MGAERPFGPDIYAMVFADDASGRNLIAARSPKPCAYIRVNVGEMGVDVVDIFGARRHVTYDPVRTKSLPVTLGESPIHIVGPKGLKATPRPDPGW